jgi:hypothetical protein
VSVASFGQIVTGRHVELALIQHLQLWLPVYVAEVSEQDGHPRNFYAQPRSYERWSAWDATMPEDQTPAVVVVSPGLAEEPSRRGDTWTAKWSVSVAAIVTARTKSEGRDLVEAYCAAVRASVMQHRSLGGFAAGCSWVDETYALDSPADERTWVPGMVSFTVEVNDVLDAQLGPAEAPSVPTDPVPDPSQFATIQTTIQKDGVFE